MRCQSSNLFTSSISPWRLVLVIVIYLTVVVVCIVTHAPLIDNPNRAGRLPRLHHPCAMLTLRRFHGSRAASSRLSLCNEELNTFPPSGTRPWIRETELRSSLVWPWNVPCRRHPWFPLDSKSHPISPSYLRSAKRDLWRRRIRTSLHHRAFLPQTGSNLSPPDFLLCSVRASYYVHLKTS